jgi:hypothetical protein
MNRNRTVWTILSVLIGATLLWAGDPWKERPYTEWTEKECRKLLQNSPWAKHYTDVGVIIELVAPGQIDSAERGRESNPRMEYRVRLLSALPIRQALVRLQQINADYDEMSPEQRQAFDHKAEAILNMPFDDTVVLLVDYGSNTDVYDKEMARYWQHQSTETLKNVVFLRGHAGEEVPLLSYAAEQGAARTFEVVFPRESEGRPLLRPDSKTLRLDFLHPNIRGQGEVRAFVEFKVKRMLIEGEVLY